MITGRASPLAPLALVAGMGMVAAFAATGGAGVAAFEQGAALAAGLVLAVIAVVVRPAWTISAALALTVFSEHWDLLGSPFPIDRLALGLGTASLLVREWRHRDGRLQTRPIDWLLMLVALYALVSAAVAGTLDDSHARFTLFDRYGLVPFLVFFVTPFAFRTDYDRRILLGTLVALGGYLGVTALLETIGPKGLILPRYITDPTVGIHADRARGPFVDAVANGLAMYFCAVACVLAFLRWRRTAWRVCAVVVGGLCLLGVIFTLTRAVWLGAGIASLLAMLGSKETRRYLVPGAIAGFVLVVGALGTIPGLAERAQGRSNDKQPVWDRKNSNAAALRMVEERPLFGFGWGRFPQESLDYYRQSQDYPLSAVSDLHNVYLSNAVELGLLGAALWMLGLVGAIGGAITRRGPPELKPWKVGLIALATSLGVAWATTPSAYELPTLLLFTWAGVAWGAPAWISGVSPRTSRAAPSIARDSAAP